MKRDLYAEVSARIVTELEAGAAPWVKPWSATPGANTPCNAVSNRPYSGCNVILLPTRGGSFVVRSSRSGSSTAFAVSPWNAEEAEVTVASDWTISNNATCAN